MIISKNLLYFLESNIKCTVLFRTKTILCGSPFMVVGTIYRHMLICFNYYPIYQLFRDSFSSLVVSNSLILNDLKRVIVRVEFDRLGSRPCMSEWVLQIFIHRSQRKRDLRITTVVSRPKRTNGESRNLSEVRPKGDYRFTYVGEVRSF